MVAGVGNVFLGDDGFGVAVAGRLAGAALPGGARARDYGIRGVHLAHELMNGYDGLVLIDAVQRGGPPGTVYVLEPAEPDDDAAGPALDAHDMTPGTVLALLRRFGVRLPWVTVVGCEPADVREGMGLSPPVLGAVDEAVRLVRELLAERLGGDGRHGGNGEGTEDGRHA
ncbi:hydrogenase maturation protease [Streptomyces sp. NPDC050315]|uniref:hydrogenase maturation protease n=1 Tax=Streptomyces sp. NPDC050315 TaxID=3155039 RepID=UPI003412BFA3